MRPQEAPPLAEPLQQALAELRRLITQQLPRASFAVRQGVDDPEQTLLVATVDIEDPDTVLDIVLPRLLELKFDEGLPINVVPVHTPARSAATRERIAGHQGRSRVPRVGAARPARGL